MKAIFLGGPRDGTVMDNIGSYAPDTLKLPSRALTETMLYSKDMATYEDSVIETIAYQKLPMDRLHSRHVYTNVAIYVCSEPWL